MRRQGDGSEFSHVVAKLQPDETGKTTQPGVIGRIDLWQQRYAVVAFPVAVVRKFSDDRAGRMAALIAYYGFFSLFPALLVFVTVLGFLLDGNSLSSQDMANSVLAQFPIIGDSLGNEVGEPLTGSALALGIGLAAALWAGLSAMQATQDAMNGVWDVERARYPNFFFKRVRSLIMLVIVGVLLLAATGLGQFSLHFVQGRPASIALFVASVAFNVVGFAVAFRLLTVSNVGWRDVAPGAVVAAVGYGLLQLLGGTYVTRRLDGAGVYGTFAVVIGLLSWIFLVAQVMVFSAEVNVVATRKLWPRSIAGRPITRSDRASAAAQAEEHSFHETMSIQVAFEDEATPEIDSQMPT
jgi:membrane protein